MKLNLEIKVPSSSLWLKTVLENFNDFLIDHADCERKASMMAMSFVAKYPNRVEIIPELIETAIEELEHFQEVVGLMMKRGIQLPDKMKEDPYIKLLMKHAQHGRNERFMDRMLIASVLETRGAERFRMIEESLDDPGLKRFYKKLWTSEAKHGHIFVKMALTYFEKEKVYARLEEWLDIESEVIGQLELRPALH